MPSVKMVSSYVENVTSPLSSWHQTIITHNSWLRKLPLACRLKKKKINISFIDWFIRLTNHWFYFTKIRCLWWFVLTQTLLWDAISYSGSPVSSNFGISITLQCFVHFCGLSPISNDILRVWSLARFTFLKSESDELKKLLDLTLAIQTELNISLQELFTHSVPVVSITFYHVEIIISEALAEIRLWYEIIWKDIFECTSNGFWKKEITSKMHLKKKTL